MRTHPEYSWLRAGVARHARALFPEGWQDRVEVEYIVTVLLEDGVTDLSELAPGELNPLIAYGGGVHA